MAESIPDAAEREEKELRRQRRTTGYFACKRIILVLKEFSDLVRYDFYLESQYANRPLEKLVPGAENPQNRERLLRAAINRLIEPVRHALWLANVNTEMVLEKYESEPFEDPKKVQRLYDLLEDYFEPDHHGHLEHYRRVIEALDRGIGHFEQKQKAAFRQLFNPATWLAWFVRFPITVFERAGLEGEEASSTVLKIYAWAIRALALVVLALLAEKLGITAVWEKLVSFIASK